MTTELSSPAHPSFLATLRNWANSSRAERDLQTIFGDALDWSSAYRHLAALQSGDFSLLPEIRVLRGHSMEALWGGYSRDLRLVFLSADCPEDLVVPVLLEEIGHFFDQEFCAAETPGDEGALFSALVLGDKSRAGEVLADDFETLEFAGARIPVEAAKKKKFGKSGRGGKSRGSSSSRNKMRGVVASGSSTSTSAGGEVVFANQESVRVAQTESGQRLVGSGGNDTFAVTESTAQIQTSGGKDTIESPVSFDLAKYGAISNLTLTGTGNINGTGNKRANVITGNSGNNRLDGGVDEEIDTLVGGAGDDTYVFRDTLDQVVEGANGGSDTIETTINSLSLSDLNVANVENLAFVGEGSATLSGNALANVLTGGKLADTLFGSEGDTLIGWQGDDFYYVAQQSTRVLESDGALDGNDTISTALATYSMAAARNVEVLVYAGNSNAALTGNTGKNTIFGGLAVRNTINGGEADDYLYGGDTTDSLFGGAGNDTIAVTRWADPVLVGSLGASLKSGTGSDTLNGGVGDDTLNGGNFSDEDSLTGGDGSDRYTVFAYDVVVEELKDGDTDTVLTTVNNYQLPKGVENLELASAGQFGLSVGVKKANGNSLSNLITGNGEDNEIAAGLGDDELFGGGGADKLKGQIGNDKL